MKASVVIQDFVDLNLDQATLRFCVCFIFAGLYNSNFSVPYYWKLLCFFLDCCLLLRLGLDFLVVGHCGHILLWISQDCYSSLTILGVTLATFSID